MTKLFYAIELKFTMKKKKNYRSIFLAYEIMLKNDGPIVKGGTIRFMVMVYDNNVPSTDVMRFEWSDDAIPHHTRKV